MKKMWYLYILAGLSLVLAVSVLSYLQRKMKAMSDEFLIAFMKCVTEFRKLCVTR